MPIQKITSGVIESSQTLTTPTISGNLSLDSTGTTGVRVPSANTMAFHTAGTEDMRITSAGNVGIGTTSPASKLDVFADTVTFGDTGSFNFAINGTNVLFKNGSGGTTECMRITSAGDLRFNSGYGSVAAAYGCRAWVNFDGYTNTGGFCTIRGSGNVTSVADNGTGDYTVNFTTALPDVNYCAQYSIGALNSNFWGPVPYIYSQATTSCRVRSVFSNGTFNDADSNISIFR